MITAFADYAATSIKANRLLCQSGRPVLLLHQLLRGGGLLAQRRAHQRRQLPDRRHHRRHRVRHPGAVLPDDGPDGHPHPPPGPGVLRACPPGAGPQPGDRGPGGAGPGGGPPPRGAGLPGRVLPLPGRGGGHPEPPELRLPPGGDHRHHRRHRQRQVHRGLPDPPVPRRHRRRHPAQRHRHPGHDPGVPPGPPGLCPAEGVALLRHHRGEPALQPPRRHGGGADARRRRGPGRGLHPLPARRAELLRGPGGHQLLRRPEAAAVHRPGPGEAPGAVHL